MLPRHYRIAFGACYAYSPKGSSEVSARSRLLCARLKGCSSRWLARYALRVREQVLQEQQFCGFFSEGAVLIPVPPSDSRTRACSWAAWQLALAIKATGLGGAVWTGLRRVTSVDRSSAAWAWQRPTVREHYRSITVTQSMSAPAQVLLVDDVITKGRTLVAAAIRLHEAFPRSRIRAFALLRTMGFVRDIERLIDPCQGQVQWNGVDAYRDP